jgi:hypothetical protein
MVAVVRVWAVLVALDASAAPVTAPPSMIAVAAVSTTLRVSPFMTKPFPAGRRCRSRRPYNLRALGDDKSARTVVNRLRLDGFPAKTGLDLTLCP